MLPVLYSFRRCPYAMRARMALIASRTQIELREVVLRDKPESMLQASPKGKFPVLILSDGTVIDESIDVMQWCLRQNDPLNLLPNQQDFKVTQKLIDENDGVFKENLDLYKYSVRFPEKSEEEYREQGEVFLKKLEERLQGQTYLLGSKPSLVDVAIFPFIRQFAFVKIKWFETSEYTELRRWLNHWLESELFLSVMEKYPQWRMEGDVVLFGK